MTDREAVPPWQHAALILLVLYLMIILLLTFLPGTEDTGRNVRVNVHPFDSIRPALRLGPESRSYRQLVANIIAFVPLGILLPLVRPRISWAAVLLIGFSLSLAIELGQLAISLYVGYGYRAADVDDVILNVTGTAIGLFIVTVAVAGGRVLRRDR